MVYWLIIISAIALIFILYYIVDYGIIKRLNTDIKTLRDKNTEYATQIYLLKSQILSLKDTLHAQQQSLFDMQLHMSRINKFNKSVYEIDCKCNDGLVENAVCPKCYGRGKILVFVDNSINPSC